MQVQNLSHVLDVPKCFWSGWWPLCRYYQNAFQNVCECQILYCGRSNHRNLELYSLTDLKKRHFYLSVVHWRQPSNATGPKQREANEKCQALGCRWYSWSHPKTGLRTMSWHLLSFALSHAVKPSGRHYICTVLEQEHLHKRVLQGQGNEKEPDLKCPAPELLQPRAPQIADFPKTKH